LNELRAANAGAWEQRPAQTLEDMPKVFACVKNQNLGFTIPYTLNGEGAQLPSRLHRSF
jgi:type III restriction enzyme